MSRDVFVSGLNTKFILDRLFEENYPDFDKTIEIALAMEKATLGANKIFQPHKAVNQVRQHFPRKAYDKSNDRHNLGKVNKPSNQNQSLWCMGCGKLGHKAPECY